MKIGKNGFQSAFLLVKKKTPEQSHMMGKGAVYLLCLNRFSSILGSGLEKDLICVQDPHGNVCKVKTLSGDSDLFAFTRDRVRGLIVEDLEGGNVEMSDRLSQ